MGPATIAVFSRCRDNSCCGSSGYANECTPTDPCPTTPVVPDDLTFDYINLKWTVDNQCYRVFLGGTDPTVGPVLTLSETAMTCP